MRITSKQEGSTKSHQARTRINGKAARLTDLLGDFSEQTGALFG